jgi:hypothetical protein
MPAARPCSVSPGISLFHPLCQKPPVHAFFAGTRAGRLSHTRDVCNTPYCVLHNTGCRTAKPNSGAAHAHARAHLQVLLGSHDALADVCKYCCRLQHLIKILFSARGKRHHVGGMSAWGQGVHMRVRTTPTHCRAVKRACASAPHTCQLASRKLCCDSMPPQSACRSSSAGRPRCW